MIAGIFTATIPFHPEGGRAEGRTNQASSNRLRPTQP